MALIELKDIRKTYDAKGVPAPALRGVSLSVDRGEFVCIAGSSGSGKTTLLHLMGGLDFPTEGTVSIEGESTASMSGTRLASMRLHRIGFVFQAFNLIPVLTAYENVEYVLLLKGLPAAERRTRVTEALACVGLSGFGARRPAELSGGQQQRVAVARAIVSAPPIVIADEPTANLDSATGEELVALLHAINRNSGTTFVFSSHDPLIIGRADRVITLKDGMVADDVRPSRQEKALR